MKAFSEFKKTLIDDVKMNNPEYEFKRDYFLRQGIEDTKNQVAAEKSITTARMYYEGQQLHALVDSCDEIYQLQKENPPHAHTAIWLTPYLPIFSSNVFKRLKEKHQVEYNYTDLSEIYLQSMTICMLAHCCNPALFNENEEEFEALVMGWLEVLLLLNIVKNPEMKTFYSSDQNLIDIINMLVELSAVSDALIQKFAPLLPNPILVPAIEQYKKNINYYNELSNVLVRVSSDHQKINSVAFLDAINYLRSINQHQSILDDTVVAMPIVSGEELDLSNTLAIAISEEQNREALNYITQSFSVSDRAIQRELFLCNMNGQPVDFTNLQEIADQATNEHIKNAGSVFK